MAFALSWSAEYVGSFPVDSVHSANQKVADRLSQLRNSASVRSVLLSVSIAGVKVSSIDRQLVYMAHALKRISYATCDADYCQVAFVAREPSVKNENADPSTPMQRLCHVFRTESYDTADEINCVLGNAFRAAYLHKVGERGERRRRRSVEKAREKQPNGSSGGDSALSSTCSDCPSIDFDDNKRLGGGSVQSRSTTSPPPPPPAKQPVVAMPRPLYDDDGFVRPTAPRALRPHSVMVSGSVGIGRQSDFAAPLDFDAITSCSTTPTSSSDLSRSSKRSSSSALLRRLFGGKEKQSPSPEAIVMRPPMESKKRRRPVSAVFSHAFSRITSSTSTAAMSPSPRASNKTLSASMGKRMSRIELPSPNDRLRQFDHAEQSRRSQSVGNVHRVLATKPSDIGVGRSPGVGCNDRCRAVDQLTVSPIYNSQTSEWLMPIDLEVERALCTVPWYSGDTDRDFVVKVLRSQPDGAFVVRKSLSHRCCLALSVRVPETHNSAAVSHYLILHSKDGFRLKGFHKAFPSVPTLVTHHSVMQEQLPCRLVFVNWDRRVWAQQSTSHHDYDTPSSEAVYGSLELPLKAT
uniref:SH2 domain-containing protein n=1 Tax=Plectus sambesii TaxID=2011161 RepID=A0A914W2W9_9BILA